MKYLLDTNACIDYLTGRYPNVVSRVQHSSPTDLCLSSIVVAELRYGADKSQKPRQNHQRVDTLTNEIPVKDFDATAAKIYGKVRANLERKGTVIGPNDMLIASHAQSLGLVLVTDNVAEFRRVKQLKVENWR
jgi:tRNA(fMet)-specific endonuclease VapC